MLKGQHKDHNALHFVTEVKKIEKMLNKHRIIKLVGTIAIICHLIDEKF